MNQISSLAVLAWKAENEQAEAEAALTKDSCEQKHKQDKHRKKPVSEMGGKVSLLTTSLTFDVAWTGVRRLGSSWRQIQPSSVWQRSRQKGSGNFGQRSRSMAAKKVEKILRKLVGHDRRGSEMQGTKK